MNRESYDNIARQWSEARTVLGRERRYLEMLLDGLPTPASILDVGCGSGRPIAEFVLGHGHRVTGIDQSAKLLEIARASFPEATWIQARIEAYPFDGRYDGAICWDSLFHIGRAHHPRILSAVHKCLAPGGRLMLTVGGSDNPPFTDTMFGHEFFYDSLPPERVSSLLLDIGYDLLINEYLDLPGSGRDKGRVAVVAQKGRIELEPASLSDAAAIAAMEHAADTSQYIMGYSYDEHVRRMADPALIYLRILDGGKWVGFILLALEDDGTSVEFRRIVVAERGRGIGQAAIARMERFCQARLGRSRVWLDVLEDNHRGRHIYEKLGYDRFGSAPYGERTLLLYQKTLAATPDSQPHVPEALARASQPAPNAPVTDLETG